MSNIKKEKIMTNDKLREKIQKEIYTWCVEVSDYHKKAVIDNLSSFFSQALKEEREEIVAWIEKNGTTIHKGELPKAIHGILIDIEKLRKQLLTPKKKGR